MSCRFSIIGKNFNPDAYLAIAKFRSCSIKHKGEPRMVTKPEGHIMPHSVLSTLASKADFNEFDKQIKDVIRFIKRNREKLELIQSTKGVEYAGFDFSVDHDCGKFCQSLYLPPELIKLAGELGLHIEISVYDNIEKEEE
jgi:hypothetical protein